MAYKDVINPDILTFIKKNKKIKNRHYPLLNTNTIYRKIE